MPSVIPPPLSVDLCRLVKGAWAGGHGTESHRSALSLAGGREVLLQGALFSSVCLPREGPFRNPCTQRGDLVQRFLKEWWLTLHEVGSGVLAVLLAHLSLLTHPHVP